MTLDDQLASVQAAITKAEHHKEYQIKDHRMERQDIDKLYDERKRLLVEIARRDARLSTGGIRSVRFTA
jgi:hypothetical protein